MDAGRTRPRAGRGFERRVRVLALALAAAGAGLLAAGPADPGTAPFVHADLLPADSTVTPGDEFVVNLALVEEGLAINGYDATLEYDPAALTLLPTAPTSLQEGGLMKGACANTFHRFNAAADSAAIAHVLLCAGVSVNGPGQLYKLRFRASLTPQVTTIRLRAGRLKFYNAGLFVSPVVSHDAIVRIGSTVGVGDAPPAPAGLTLAARPNPTRGALHVTLEGVAAGTVRIVVHDPRGRVVRRHALSAALSAAAGDRGTVGWTWDGRDSAGRAVPAGVYGIVAESGTARVAQRVVVLR